MGILQKAYSFLCGPENICSNCGACIWRSGTIHLDSEGRRLCKNCYEKKLFHSDSGQTASSRDSSAVNRQTYIPPVNHMEKAADIVKMFQLSSDVRKSEKDEYIEIYETKDVCMKITGQPCIRYTYQAGDIYYNKSAGRSSKVSDISFSELAALTEQTDDPSAAHYRNMTRDNWRSYFYLDDPFPNPSLPSVFFGVYPQKAGGQVKQPLEWLILKDEPDRVLLITRYVIGAVTNGGTYWATNKDYAWDETDLRRWLNSRFMETAFSRAEMEKIIEVPIVSECLAPKDGSVIRQCTTKDRVFLLDKKETETFLRTEGDLCAIPTEYASVTKAKITNWSSRRYPFHVVADEWGLRDFSYDDYTNSYSNIRPGCYPVSVSSLYTFMDEGQLRTLYSAQNCAWSEIGLRPAMWIRK